MTTRSPAGQDPAAALLGSACLTNLEQLLGDRCGYRFTPVQRRSLADAVQRRLTALSGLGADEYVRRVEASTPTTGELAALLAEFTNTETHFFRHEGRFELLREHVVPALLARRRAGTPLRLLSAGCSTGEEVYSTIMSLLEIESQWANHGLEVVGCDINERALRQAREAVYGTWTLRYTPERFLARYFEPIDSDKKQWAVVERVRRYATFARVNLVGDGLLALPQMRDFDVAFCCNVMIYLDDERVEQLMKRLDGLIARNGFLFVGYTESLHARRRDYDAIWSNDYVVYRRQPPSSAAPAGGSRKGRGPRAERRPPTPDSPPALRVGEPQRRLARARSAEPRSAPTMDASLGSRAQSSYELALEHCRSDRLEQALHDVDSLLAASPFFWRARLLKGYLHGSRGEFWPAVAECTKVLDIDPVCAQAYLLLGLLLQQQGEVDSAVRETKRAIYLDPELPLAHFTLGKLLLSADRPRQAARQFANAARLLRAKPGIAVAADIPVEYDAAVLLDLADKQLRALGDG